MERSHCSKEFEEYQENLNKQVEQISNCLEKKNLTNQEKKECVLDYINKSLEPIFKCSSKKIIKSRKQKTKVKTKQQPTQQPTQQTKQQPKQEIKQQTKTKTKINVKSIPKENIKPQSINNTRPSQPQPLQVSMGRFNTPISTETIGLYINSIKNK
jgi:hypothetical protein